MKNVSALQEHVGELNGLVEAVLQMGDGDSGKTSLREFMFQDEQATEDLHTFDLRGPLCLKQSMVGSVVIKMVFSVCVKLVLLLAIIFLVCVF